MFARTTLFISAAVMAVASPTIAEPKIYWAALDASINRANVDGSSIEEILKQKSGTNEPAAIAIDTNARKMYWTDYTAAMIQRANLDGTNIEPLVTDGLLNPQGIALDTTAGKMYWVDRGAAKIQRASLDGSNVEDLVTVLGAPWAIALDPEAGKMYWTNAESSIGVTRANMDGSDAEQLIAGFAGGIALDLAAGRMYWGDGPSIKRANLDGSSVKTYLPGLGGWFVWSLTIDAAADRVYWSSFGSEGRGEISWCNLNLDSFFCGGISVSVWYISGLAVADFCDHTICDDVDACTFDRCRADGACESTPALFGDVAGSNGTCGPNGGVELTDILAVLDAFQGGYADGCGLTDLDIAQPDGCGPDGEISLFDILAVLDAFSAVDGCCPKGR